VHTEGKESLWKLWFAWDNIKMVLEVCFVIVSKKGKAIHVISRGGLEVVCDFN
jgi:hypothetical protein